MTQTVLETMRIDECQPAGFEAVTALQTPARAVQVGDCLRDGPSPAFAACGIVNHTATFS